MRWSAAMRWIVALVFLLSSGMVLAGTPADPSPKALLEEVRLDGARAVVQRLSMQDAQFGRILGLIEAGDDDWLRVAAALHSGSDAAYSLALHYAVAHAIPHNPSGVMELVGRPFPLDMVCTSPFIEPDPGVAERYQAQALSALRTVRGRLAKVAARCAAGIVGRVSSAPSSQPADHETAETTGTPATRRSDASAG